VASASGGGAVSACERTRPAAARGPARAPRARERAARRAVHTLLARVRGGEIALAEGGAVTALGSQPPPPLEPLRARIEVRSPAFHAALLRGGASAGRAYADGLWDCDDLVALVRIAARAMSPLDRWRTRLLPLTVPWQRTAWRLRSNSRARARDRVAAHYDLGNELFARFLDETMLYSCAIFERPGATLHEAQVTKLDRICRRLALAPGDRLLEIGSGWGALALHAATRYGAHVTTTTISREQHAHVTAAVHAAGLEHRVEVLLRDYRDLRGRWDKLVSIEMIEAVGWEHLDTYFGACSDLLEPHGAMLLQAIVHPHAVFRVEKASNGFINRCVFPGGTLPSLLAIERSLARRTDVRAVALDDLTPHYPRTLQLWRERFHASWPQLRAAGYDERFRRLWDLYLAYSEAGFRERRIGDVQLLLAKPAWRGEGAALTPPPASPLDAQLAPEAVPLALAIVRSSSDGRLESTGRTVR
jgi:cyclopropane-fatty-acyl-phospholipid synthase